MTDWLMVKISWFNWTDRPHATSHRYQVLVTRPRRQLNTSVPK